MNWYPLLIRPNFESDVTKDDGYVTLLTHVATQNPPRSDMNTLLVTQDSPLERFTSPDAITEVVQFTGRVLTGETVRCTLLYDNDLFSQGVILEEQPANTV